MSAPDAKNRKLEMAAFHGEPSCSSESTPEAAGSSESRCRVASTSAAPASATLLPLAPAGGTRGGSRFGILLAHAARAVDQGEFVRVDVEVRQGCLRRWIRLGCLQQFAL